MKLLNSILLVWAQHRAFRAALAELNGYTDRQLAELHIARSDIARVAFEESERRMAALTDSKSASPAAWDRPVAMAGR
jgi:uncharacterized protein YjiS (DUF1127 family)